MENMTENQLREIQLLFIGKLLAGYTHELKNKLAFINESNGLMVDTLDEVPEDNPIKNRLIKIIGNIKEKNVQVNTLAKNLSTFAHRMDCPTSTFQINEVLAEELALLERFARLQRITFEKELQPDLPSLSNNPSLLQFIIFRVVGGFIEILPPGEVIRFSTAKKNNAVELAMEAKIPEANQGSGPALDQEVIELLEYVARKINVVLSRTDSGGGGHKISLLLAGG